MKGLSSLMSRSGEVKKRFFRISRKAVHAYPPVLGAEDRELLTPSPSRLLLSGHPREAPRSLQRC